MKLLAFAVLSATFMLAVPVAICAVAPVPAVLTLAEAKPTHKSTNKAKPAKKHQKHHKHAGKHSGKHRKATATAT